MSMTLLGALCDALDCTVQDLCQFQAVATAQRKNVVNGPASNNPKVVDLNTTIRPKRAASAPRSDAYPGREALRPLPETGRKTQSEMAGGARLPALLPARCPDPWHLPGLRD
jgi:hypothetical protein